MTRRLAVLSGLAAVVFLAFMMSMAGSWADEIDPSSSRIRFVGSAEFSGLPDTLWREVFDDEECHYGLWQGKSLAAEVSHCHMTKPDYEYTERNMLFDRQMPEIFEALYKNRSTLLWGAKDSFVGAQGLVNVRYFRFNDGIDQHCVAFASLWGRSPRRKDHIVVGYMCSESAGFPLDRVVERQLHALAVEGQVDHLVVGP